jgi:DNA-binding XRE family transcriptional regulator
MQSMRAKRGMNVHDTAKALQISPRLLEEIEAGGFTHPKIALRIQEMFGLTDFETTQLVSPHHVDDVIKHQVSIRNDRFYGGGMKIYNDQETEYFNYKDHRFGRSQKA